MSPRIAAIDGNAGLINHALAPACLDEGRMETAMKLLATILAALMMLALTGCASTRQELLLKEPLFADELFGPPSVAISEDDVFAIDETMRQYVQREIQPLIRSRGPVHALTTALYEKGQLFLEYDTSTTRNAREAFASRSGNCLSLVIMTAAMAREMGLEVRFQNVMVDEAWDRSGDLYFFIGHVNLSIGPRLANSWYTGASDWMVVDFLPGRDLKRQRTQSISEVRIVSMYMNNRAAEAMANGKLDDAYAWARAAVLQDRRYLSAYNTLGVVYQKRGAHTQAEQVFRTALAAEPDNLHVMGNLVLALRRQGRLAEAETLAVELRRLQPVPPFALFHEGQQAMRDGNFRRAVQLFEREITRAPDYHEFHFWAAVALLQLGENRAAKDHLEKALENSTTREYAAIYSAKLEKMKKPRAGAVMQ